MYSKINKNTIAHLVFLSVFLGDATRMFELSQKTLSSMHLTASYSMANSKSYTLSLGFLMILTARPLICLETIKLML
jgi:hypothetical protein